ncbi:MAG: HDOD domain-containing protein [Gammaproteobacteria bacterium]|nr:HDOD domain-containing protein [Gammaproteobacteria bacterium]
MSSNFIELKMPDVSPGGAEVMKLVSDENFDILRLSKAISHDPVLTSTIIKYANAPLYRSLVEVTNVRQAVSILGLKNVRMAVVVATMRGFDKEPSELAQIFWDHSFAVATLCNLLAKRVNPRMAEEIEMTGLLHEMGCLILITNFKDQYQEVVNKSLNEQIPLEDVEKEVFGITHNDLLTRLLDQLRLPDITIHALNDLAEMETIEMLGRDVDYHMAIVALAHHMLYTLPQGQGHPVEQMPDSLENLMDKLELTIEDIDLVKANFAQAMS